VTLRELDRLFLRASKDLDARQRARIKQLRGLDKALFDELVRRIVDVIGTEDGKVKSGKGSASINRMIDLAFGVVERSQLTEFKRSAIGDLSAILKNGQDYFGAMDAKPMKEVNARVNRTMRRRMGFDPDTGKPISGGAFDRVFRNAEQRQAVSQLVYRGITAKKPMGQVVNELQALVIGRPTEIDQLPDGVMSKSIAKNLVLGLYNETDRSNSREYATRLELDCFIYAGGLIETSREFCKKHNNKVFTVEEAQKEWPKDPALPRTKREKETGVLEGYDPLIDMGRFMGASKSCRHRPRYISRELAKELRPDLPDRKD